MSATWVKPHPSRAESSFRTPGGDKVKWSKWIQGLEIGFGFEIYLEIVDWKFSGGVDSEVGLNFHGPISK